MFATLLGALPMPPVPGGEPVGTPEAIDAAVEVAISAQVEAGLEPVTDGRLRDPGFGGVLASIRDGRPVASEAVHAWRFVAERTDRAAKHALPGPYSLGRRLATGDAGERQATTLRAAERVAAAAAGLADAGCALVEIEESDAHLIGDDEAERHLFRAVHRRLVDAAGDRTHLSLSIVGGSASGAGIETILDAPYASLAVDLIAGPDNWNLVSRLRADRGVVAGALSEKGATGEAKELLLWAVRYAASTQGRGAARVGIGSAGGWANLTWESAVARMHRLGEVVRLAAMPASDELARELDPRAVSIRRAALGHDAPRPRRLRPRTTRRGGEGTG